MRKGVFSSAVEKIGDMRVFFRFGDMKLVFPRVTYGFRKPPANGKRRKGRFCLQPFFILGHGDKKKVIEALTRKCGKAILRERPADFPHGVFPEVECYHGVIVFDSSD